MMCQSARPHATTHGQGNLRVLARLQPKRRAALKYLPRRIDTDGLFGSFPKNLFECGKHGRMRRPNDQAQRPGPRDA